MTKRRIVLDIETRSTVDLRKTNITVYAKHPTTGVWLLRWQVKGESDIHPWRPGMPCPWDDLSDIEFSFHNAEFEYNIWKHILSPRYGWPMIQWSQITDTAARAARCGLPPSLERAAAAAGVLEQKDMEGSAQMKKMASPRKVHNEPDTPELLKEHKAAAERLPMSYTWHDGRLIEWWNTEDRVQRLGEYCDQDVRTQMALENTLPDLPEAEHTIWLATMRANERGALLDVDFVGKAATIVDMRLAMFNKVLHQTTGYAVTGYTKLADMRAWLQRQGVEVDSLDKNAVQDILAADVPEPVRQVVSIRAEAGKSSVGKFPAMQAHADDTGYIYAMLKYYGAIATGRWSGAGVQVQNLPARGSLGWQDAEFLIGEVKKCRTGADMMDVIDMAESLFDGSIIGHLSMCLRGAFTAPVGMAIVDADYSNIEGRYAAWLAGESWKLDAFRAFDDGDGPDLYKVAAGGILGVAPEEVPKAMRNSIGKVSELALQFQGGVGAFLSMAAVYGVQIADYWGEIEAALPNDVIAAAQQAFNDRGKSSGIERKTWIAAEAVKIAWRNKHPAIVSCWYDYEACAVSAIKNPNHVFHSNDGKVQFLCRAMFKKWVLLVRQPSGRCIHYVNVRLSRRKTDWGTVKEQIIFDKVEGGRVIPSATYGGDIFQSCVQGGARDIMANGWLNVERAGFRPVFSVHDQMVSYAVESIPELTLELYERELCRTPEWASGLPVVAEGYRAHRFRKD